MLSGIEKKPLLGTGVGLGPPGHRGWCGGVLGRVLCDFGAAGVPDWWGWAKLFWKGPRGSGWGLRRYLGGQKSQTKNSDGMHPAGGGVGFLTPEISAPPPTRTSWSFPEKFGPTPPIRYPSGPKIAEHSPQDTPTPTPMTRRPQTHPRAQQWLFFNSRQHKLFRPQFLI
jgi:hypothetical protein